MGRAWIPLLADVMNLKNTEILTSKPRSGRPSKLTHREARSVLSLVKANARTTASKVALNVQQSLKR